MCRVDTWRANIRHAAAHAGSCCPEECSSHGGGLHRRLLPLWRWQVVASCLAGAIGCLLSSQVAVVVSGGRNDAPQECRLLRLTPLAHA